MLAALVLAVPWAGLGNPKVLRGAAPGSPGMRCSPGELMGAGAEEEQGRALLLGEGLVELPLVPGMIKAPGEAELEPLELLQMQDEAGPGYCLEPSLGSICSAWARAPGNHMTPFPGASTTPISSGITRAAPMPLAQVGSSGRLWDAAGAWGSCPSAPCSPQLGWGTGRERGSR